MLPCITSLFFRGHAHVDDSFSMNLHWTNRGVTRRFVLRLSKLQTEDGPHGICQLIGCRADGLMELRAQTAAPSVLTAAHSKLGLDVLIVLLPCGQSRFVLVQLYRSSVMCPYI